jgi:hypothetical protein
MTNEQTALLAIIRAAGPEGRSASELRLGVRAIGGQEQMLQAMEDEGLLRSRPGFFGFQGRVYIATVPS